MLTKNSVFVNNIRVINMLILKLIEYINKYSVNIASSLHINWLNYLDNKSNNSKKNRSLEKIDRKLEQLKNIELRKQLKKEKDIENLLGLLESTDISGRYKKVLEKIINNNTLSDIFKELINYYKEVKFKELQLQKANEEKVDLPKKKQDFVFKKIIDKNNYLYLNLVKNGSLLTIDKRSLNNEFILYNKCLKKGDTFDVWGEFSNKLSPFEKRRKIYIQSVYKLEKDMLDMKKKKVDITYPLEKYYYFAKLIVDNLYKELTFFKANEDIYNKLMDMTITKYSFSRLLTLYNELVLKIENSELDRNIISEFQRVASIYKKKSDYIIFRGSLWVVPTFKDLLIVLNKRIISSIDNNINNYFNDLNYKINRVTKYMKIEEIVLLYNEFKNKLVKINLKTEDLLIKYNLLQEVIIDIIVNKFGINKDEVLTKYLIN